MSKVRSERASSEMWKVAGLAVVSVLCFTLSAAVALFTDIPWTEDKWCLYISSHGFVLFYRFFYTFSICAMGDERTTTSLVTFSQQESSTIAFISDSSATVQPQRWTAAASVQNQVSRASPI